MWPKLNASRGYEYGPESGNAMKIKIISDGTNPGTRVYTEDGVELENIVAIDWRIKEGCLASARLVVLKAPVEVEGEASDD